MGVLMLILKVIGIFLGVLLAVLLLLLAAAITVPVRYRVDVKIQQKKAEVGAACSWLLHIIDFRFCYGEDGTAFQLRIMGIPFRLQKEKRRKTKREKKKAIPKAEKIKDSASPTAAEPEAAENHANNIQTRGKNRTDEQIDTEREQKEERRYFGRIREFKEKIKSKISDIKAAIAAAKEKIRDIKEIISDETNQNAIMKIWRELKYLLRHYAPRKAWGELSFGMADPSQTGRILGALSVLPFWAQYKISIYPDFQSEAFFAEGWLRLKGHIRLWHFLVSVVRLLKDKNIRLLLEKIRT